MKTVITSFFIAVLCIQNTLAQTQAFNQNFLLGEETIDNNGANNNPELLYHDKNMDINDAKNKAKHLLMQAPTKLPKIKIPTTKKSTQKTDQNTKATNVFSVEKRSEAPFGLFWGATQAETLSQGVVLTPITLKDYDNSFSAAS